MVVKGLFKKIITITNMLITGRKFLEKQRKIRATITIEVPYSNELMNYGDKLNKKLKQVIADTDYIPHQTEAGHLEPTTRPVVSDL